MIVNAIQFAEFLGKSPAWVTEQVRKGMPIESKGKGGRDYEIDSGIALEWMIDIKHGIARNIADGRVMTAREVRDELKRLRQLVAQLQEGSDGAPA